MNWVRARAEQNVGESPAVVMEEIDGVTWVKQEVAPGPQGITDVVEACGNGLVGTMSGFGALYSPTDWARGVTASIHACEFCDLVQRVWDLFDEGKEDEARDFHYAILPALQLEGLFGMMYAKEIMVRRGVFEPKHVRLRTRTRPLTQQDMREIDRVWARTEPMLLWKKIKGRQMTDVKGQRSYLWRHISRRQWRGCSYGAIYPDASGAAVPVAPYIQTPVARLFLWRHIQTPVARLFLHLTVYKRPGKMFYTKRMAII